MVNSNVVCVVVHPFKNVRTFDDGFWVFIMVDIVLIMLPENIHLNWMVVHLRQRMCCIQTIQYVTDTNCTAPVYLVIIINSYRLTRDRFTRHFVHTISLLQFHHPNSLYPHVLVFRVLPQRLSFVLVLVTIFLFVSRIKTAVLRHGENSTLF